MSNTLVSVISDAASLIGVPTETAKRFLNRRQEKLQNIILEEIRDGDFSKVHQDDIISIIIRLLNDRKEGVGKNNIRLLARTIVGLNNKERLTASKFYYFNTILAPLSNEQIVFLAETVKAYNNPIAKNYGGPNQGFITSIKIDPRDIFSVREAVKKTKRSYILLSLLKTGFFEPCPPNLTDATLAYKLSPLFIEFMNLIDNWDDIANWIEE